MKINRENYEIYFIDLLDGTLPTETVDELLDFLQENPDLAQELKGLENIKLIPEEDTHIDHIKLLKSEIQQPGVFEESCIRSIENELSEKERKEFDAYISKHPDAEKEYKLFQATIAEPDPFITYAHKEKLKRTRKIMPLWYAAAAVLVFGVLFWFNASETQNDMPVAQTVYLNELSPEIRVDIESLKGNFMPLPEKRELVAEKETIEIYEEREQLEDLPVLNSNIVLANARFETDNSFDLIQHKTRVQKQRYIPTVPELLAQEINKIDAKQEVNKIGRFALEKLSDFTDDKISYETSGEGKINKIEYNSRLLAFSFPVNNKNN